MGRGRWQWWMEADAWLVRSGSQLHRRARRAQPRMRRGGTSEGRADDASGGERGGGRGWAEGGVLPVFSRDFLSPPRLLFRGGGNFPLPFFGTRLYITRSLPPSTGICAPVVLANAGPQTSAASSATSRLLTSTWSTL